MRASFRIALLFALLIAFAPPTDAGLRQALQHYKDNDFLAAVKALEGEEGEQAAYIAGRCHLRLAEIYASMERHNLLYGLDYYRELERGQGDKPSVRLPRFQRNYQSALAAGAEGQAGGSAEGKELKALDAPDEIENVEEDKRLLFYAPGAHGRQAGRFLDQAVRRFVALIESEGKYATMAKYYLATAEGLATGGRGSAADQKLSLEPLEEVAASGLPAYSEPAKVYLAVLAGGDGLAAAGDDQGLRALALKLSARRGRDEPSLRRAADELKVQLAEGKKRAELWMLGSFYLETGDEEAALEALEQARDKSNKNSVAHNDPLFMLELARAYYLINRYDECLEILMALSERFSGLRPLQNSVQGVYAARQKSAGQVRINQ